MCKPLISIIVATRNRAELLPLAIESLLNQTYQNIEIVIVDDASSDDTLIVIDRLKKSDTRIISLRSELNIGPGGARNLGIAHSRGDYIAIMDDDDIAYPERLEIQLETIVKNPDVGLVFSLVEVVNGQYQVIRIHPDILIEGNFPRDPKEVFKLNYLAYCYIPNTTIFIKRQSLGDIRYIEDHWIGEDWFLILQLSAKGIKMFGVNQPLVKLYRAKERKGLLTSPEANQYKRRIQLIIKMRHWLKKEGIKEFDTYYRIALSNGYILGSTIKTGLKGFLLCLLGLILYPKNQWGITTFHIYIRRFLKWFREG